MSCNEKLRSQIAISFVRRHGVGLLNGIIQSINLFCDFLLMQIARDASASPVGLPLSRRAKQSPYDQLCLLGILECSCGRALVMLIETVNWTLKRRKWGFSEWIRALFCLSSNIELMWMNLATFFPEYSPFLIFYDTAAISNKSPSRYQPLSGYFSGIVKTICQLGIIYISEKLLASTEKENILFVKKVFLSEKCHSEIVSKFGV